MTVANTTALNQYAATSGQTVFPYTFEIFDKDDVVVLQNTTTLAEGTNYTVSGVGNNTGGNITLLVGATAGDTITVYREMPLQRTTDYQTSGDFLAQEVNDDFDRLWLAAQQNSTSFDRAIRKPVTDLTSVNMELPNAVTRANRYLGFGPSGEVVTLASTGTAGNIADVKSYGADSTGTNDSTAAFQAAVDSGLSVIYIPTGTYKISSTITVNRDIMIYGDGPGSKIDVGALGDTGTAFEFTGGGGTLIESNANAIKPAERRYTFSSTDHGLVADDLFAVWDDNDFSYSNSRANYYKGEYLTVNYVDGAEVSFDESFYDAYGSGTSKLYKVSTISVCLKDFDVIASSGLFAAFNIHFGRQCNIDNVNINLSKAYTGLYIHNCYDTSITNCSFKISDTRDTDAGFGMYPLLIGNCQRIRVTACNAVSRWHAISVGGAADGLNIVNRNIIINGCTLSCQNGAFPGDFHGNVEHSTYANCTLHGSGCTIGSNYNSFVNNKIMDITRDVTGGFGPDTADTGSQGFYGSETVGYNFLISGNLMECYGSYITNNFGRFINIVRTNASSQSLLSSLQIVNNNYLNSSTVQPRADHIISIYDASLNGPPDNVDILINGNSFINKNDPTNGSNSINIRTDNTDSLDKFKSITITGNKLHRVDINLDYVSEAYVCDNELTEPFQGIIINFYSNCTIKNNLIKSSRAIGMVVGNADGDYTIIDGNVIVDSWATLTPSSGTSLSADVSLSATSDMDYVRFSNNYIKTNGNADFALIYNNSYNIQEFNNKIVGSGAVGKIEHWQGDSSQYVVGGQSITTREFWHVGTTQTDFAVISFNNAGFNGSALVRLHMANNATGYSGILEFTLEGQDGATAVQSGTRYTSTSDPIAGGKVIVSIATDVVTLSLDGASATETIHCKAEIIKSCQASVLRYLDVDWNV